MIDWKAQRLWIGGIVLAVIIGVVSAPLLDASQKKEAQRLEELRKRTETDDLALRQLNEDIAATEKLKTQLKAADVAKAMPPVDRLRVAEILERHAAESHLTHFIYTLSPEEKTVVDTIGAGKQTLASSKLSLSADAPTDTDAYQFIETLRRAFPGRLAFQDVSVQRIGAEATTISNANIHLTASGDWLSNGANPVLTGKTP